jgi:hypothetical protein
VLKRGLSSLAVLAFALALTTPAMANHQGADSPDNGSPSANAQPHAAGILSTDEANGADVCGNTAVEGWAESRGTGPAGGKANNLGFTKRSENSLDNCK